jgi:transcriptional regulator with XRE-family HTH domain
LCCYTPLYRTRGYREEENLKLDPAAVIEARERLGLTIEMAADRADVSKNSIGRAEHGLDIRPVTARRIARGLGLEVADLYPKAPAPQPSLKGLQRDEARNLVERAAGIVEGYSRRWEAELELLAEADIYPYGKEIEVTRFFLELVEALTGSGLMDLANSWAAGGDDASPIEVAAGRRLVDAAEEADETAMQVRDAERDMRTAGAVDVGRTLAELEELAT